MAGGDHPQPGNDPPAPDPAVADTADRAAAIARRAEGSPAIAGTVPCVIETIVSPFHCLYQDALAFHQQSRLKAAESTAEASRLARASLLLYVSAAEALVHQAAVELGRPELTGLLSDPEHPLPLFLACKLLPALVGTPGAGGFSPEAPPWPQFAELLALRNAWTYPGPAIQRRAYYRAPFQGAAYEPLAPHQQPPGLHLDTESLIYPRTGLPRDPYALRPRHLDTVRGVLDSAIEALDRRLDGALTRDSRHRKEPVRLIHPR
jgi:hypothetical protein